MSAQTDELFARIAKKQQKNLTVSRELAGVLDDVTEPKEVSAFAEWALWRALVDVHGADEIREKIEDVQAGIESHHRLPEPESYWLDE